MQIIQISKTFVSLLNVITQTNLGEQTDRIFSINVEVDYIAMKNLGINFFVRYSVESAWKILDWITRQTPFVFLHVVMSIVRS